MERRKITLGAALMVVGLSAAPASAQVPSVVVPPLLPTVSACDVSVVDSDSVRVAGVVDPNTLATTFRVEYGLLGGLLNHSSLALDVGSLLGPTTVSTQLDDLVVGGSYGCRLVAVNQAGPVTGLVTNFNVATGSGGSGGSGGSDGTGGTDGSSGSGGSGATPFVNPVTGQVVAAGTPGAVKCTLAGTAGADNLRGTGRADVICGLGGADGISGLAGDDTLIGGTGNDRVKGNRGNDRVQGNKGKDKLRGGKGKDNLNGHAGADKLVGWKGRDRMAGGRGGDRFVAHRDRRGGDRVMGGKGRDRASINRGDRTRSIERPRMMG